MDWVFQNVSATDVLLVGAAYSGISTGIGIYNGYQTIGIDAINTVGIPRLLTGAILTGITLVSFEYIKGAVKLGTFNPLLVIPYMIFDTTETLAEAAVGTLYSGVDKLTGGVLNKAASQFGLAPGQGTTTDKVRRGGTLFFLTNPVTAPFVAVGAGINAMFNKKTRENLKQCGRDNRNVGKKIGCGLKKLFGF